MYIRSCPPMWCWGRGLQQCHANPQPQAGRDQDHLSAQCPARLEGPRALAWPRFCWVGTNEEVNTAKVKPRQMSGKSRSNWTKPNPEPAPNREGNLHCRTHHPHPYQIKNVGGGVLHHGPAEYGPTRERCCAEDGQRAKVNNKLLSSSWNVCNFTHAECHLLSRKHFLIVQ